MLKNIVFILCFLFTPSVYANNSTNNTFVSICYHDVKTITQGDLASDQFAISPDNLLSHFQWLKANNYHPISLDDVLAAQLGKKKLPEKAVLLSFDDAYISFYTKIYPLLKLYNYPAIIAIVGTWLETPSQNSVQYGEEKISRSNFITWSQLREMQASGLVEIASHSYNLHKGILANPQKNTQPAAITREFNFKTKQYETDKQYLERIKNDLQKNSDLIKTHMGKKPRVIAWPYGAYSKETMAIARQLGMPFNLSLENSKTNTLDNLSLINRKLIMANPGTSDLAYMLNEDFKPGPIRMIHVDLDYIYDKDPVQQNKNLGLLLDRIKRFHINTVYLQAFADPDGDGNVNSLYFPNRHLPMRADLFNRVAWQLRTRSGVNVFAWMPVLAFDLGEPLFSKYGVKEIKEGRRINTTASYKRLSPFFPETKRIIKEIYSDLAKHTKFYGILYHDDSYFTDFEDFSDAAIQWYHQQGITQSPNEIISQPKLITQLAKIKTDYLIQFTNELSDIIRKYQPNIKTARNIYARPVLQKNSEDWFAHNLEKFVDNYDTTAIMAMPWMEEASDPHLWLAQLSNAVQKRLSPEQQSKILFELQSIDWKTSKPIDTPVMMKQVNFLLRKGFNNIGYYPDDLYHNHPDIQQFKSVFSLQAFPFSK